MLSSLRQKVVLGSADGTLKVDVISEGWGWGGYEVPDNNCDKVDLGLYEAYIMVPTFEARNASRLGAFGCRPARRGRVSLASLRGSWAIFLKDGSCMCCTGASISIVNAGD